MPARRLLVLLLLVVGAGCARLAPASRQVAAVPLPASGADPAPFEAAIARRLAGLATFRAKGVLRFERAGYRVRQVDFLLLSRGRYDLRLRGSRALGPMLFELVADAEQFAFSIPIRRQWYAGRRGQEEADSPLLVPSSVIDPLRIELQPDSTRYVAHYPTETHLVELGRAGGAGALHVLRRIEFGGATGRPSRVLAYGEDGALVRVTSFGDYRQLPDMGPDDAFPFRVQVERPAAGMIVTFTFREVVPNVTAPAGAFDLTPPAGYTVLPAADFDPDRLAAEAEGDGAE